MRIYWVGDRGFIEIDENKLEGLAEIKASGCCLDVHIRVDINDETQKIPLAFVDKIKSEMEKSV